MNWLELGTIFAVASLLSLVYYGGLWLTLQQLFLAKPEGGALAWWRQPVVFVTLSFVLRTLLVVFGLYLITSGQFLPLLVAMAAFVLVRMLLVQRIGTVY
ncbi:MAG TPA: ATP synthase subunit I [Caldilineaceae bacterium]|nr:ATP synthase subunit I [Caldilineaceae bacterium]